MGLLKAVVVVLCFNTIHCEVSLLHPCAKNDITCLTQSTEKFLENTHKGIKEMDIRPIDPMTIPDLTYEDKDSGLVYHFQDVTVTGLKNQKISDFKLDTDAKTVVLKTKADLHITSDVTIELKKQSKSFKGKYTADTSVIGSTSYSYDLKTDVLGVRHFEVGTESITCETVQDPKVTLDKDLEQAITNALPIPFPTCKADDTDCLRRGLRTFFILMDSMHLGMKPIDPIIINSVSVAYEEEQTKFLLRKAKVTGARWTKLLVRRFNAAERKNGAVFSSDLHVTGDFFMSVPNRLEPYTAFLTMDIYGVESNVSYTWTSERGIDNEFYLLLGPESIAVRNSKIPSFFLQPKTEDASVLESVLVMKPSILDHLANEITTSLIYTIIDNFRLFTSEVPIKYYYSN